MAGPVGCKARVFVTAEVGRGVFVERDRRAPERRRTTYARYEYYTEH
jgi:hypothetical protein